MRVFFAHLAERSPQDADREPETLSYVEAELADLADVICDEEALSN